MKSRRLGNSSDVASHISFGGCETHLNPTSQACAGEPYHHSEIPVTSNCCELSLSFTHDRSCCVWQVHISTYRNHSKGWLQVCSVRPCLPFQSCFALRPFTAMSRFRQDIVGASHCQSTCTTTGVNHLDVVVQHQSLRATKVPFTKPVCPMGKRS